MLLSQLGHAQLQRSIVNPSFEQAFTGPRSSVLNEFFSRTDWISVDRGELVGWETTHPLQSNGCPAGGGYSIASYNCTPIELWANSFIVPPLQGIVVAELNAYTSSKLYQNICLVNGEQFTFDFGHRGRSGIERMVFESGSTTILDVSTGNTGLLGTINASGATATSRTLAGTWTRYAGTFTYTGVSGLQELGFRAIVPATGGVGNVLDDINVRLKPYIEFQANPTSQAEDSASGQLPRLRVVGVIPSGGITITLNISGTATFGSDFDYSGVTTLTGVSGSATQLTFTIPAGNYSDEAGNSVFNLPVNINSDSTIEINETIILSFPSVAASAPYVLSSTMTCGGAAIASTTHTIVNDDTDLQITKTGTSYVNAGDSVSYTLTITNNGPLVAHGASFRDSVPTQITAVTATCGLASGGAGGCSVGLSGNSVTGTVGTFPVGAVQVVSITGLAATSGNVTNTATLQPPVGTGDPQCTGTPLVCTGNNQSSQDTMIVMARLGLAKVLERIIPENSAPSNHNYTLVYRFTLENFGDLLLNSLVLSDDVQTLFSGLNPRNYNVWLSVPANQASLSVAPSLTLNPLYNGSALSNLLQSGQNLGIGETKHMYLSFDVTVNPVFIPNHTLRDNQASLEGSAGSIVALDVSTNGLDPDPNNDNNPDEHEVTPASFVKLVKQLRNCGSGLSSCSGSYITSETGEPGDYLEYRIRYYNISSQSITTLEVSDTLVPETPFQEDTYSIITPEIADFSVVCPDSSTVAIDASDPAVSITFTGGVISAFDVDVNAVCNVTTIAPAEQGYLLFKVRIP